jgi:DNA-binding MarR family transcriptional regulator
MNRSRNLAVLTWLRLVRVAQKVSHAGADHITSHGLTGGLYDALAQIGADEGITQQEMAQRLLVTEGNVSQLLTKLERQRLIEKQQEGHAKHIYLTEAGRALLDEITPRHDAFITERLTVLSEAELKQLSQLLRKLDQRLGE